MDVDQLTEEEAVRAPRLANANGGGAGGGPG